MNIRYISHAEIKFDISKRYGINYSKSQIENVLQNPEKIEDTRKYRKIAQKQEIQHILYEWCMKKRIMMW